MSMEKTPQAPREEKTDKRYYTASGEDITSVVAPAEEFIEKFCSSKSGEPAITPQTREAMLYTIRMVLYSNNIRAYNFPWDSSDNDIHDSHNTARDMVAERKAYQEAIGNIPEEEQDILEKLQSTLRKIVSDGLAPHAAKYHILARLEYSIETVNVLDKLDLISQQILNLEQEVPRPVDAETIIEIVQKILNSKLAELQGNTKERNHLEEEVLVDMTRSQTLFDLDKSGLLRQLYDEAWTRINIICSDNKLGISQKQVALEELSAAIDKTREVMMIADEEEIVALERLDEGDTPLLYGPEAEAHNPDGPILF